MEKVWATRRVGEIIDQLDLHGQSKELIDELVELSKKHGIMTPYTSFLADERVDMADRPALSTHAGQSADVQLRRSSGAEGFAQRRFKAQLAPSAAPLGAGESLKALRDAGVDSLDAGTQSDKPTVQSIGQKTFFWKQDRWQDAAVTSEQESQAIRIGQFSDEYFALASREGGKYAKYLAQHKTVLVESAGRRIGLSRRSERER